MMRSPFWIFMASMWLLVLVSNVRWAGAEDDCGMPTASVTPALGGVLCIGEGW